MSKRGDARNARRSLDTLFGADKLGQSQPSRTGGGDRWANVPGQAERRAESKKRQEQAKAKAKANKEAKANKAGKGGKKGKGGGKSRGFF